MKKEKLLPRTGMYSKVCYFLEKSFPFSLAPHLILFSLDDGRRGCGERQSAPVGGKVRGLKKKKKPAVPVRARCIIRVYCIKLTNW